jgi:hypothetical protein
LIGGEDDLAADGRVEAKGGAGFFGDQKFVDEKFPTRAEIERRSGRSGRGGGGAGRREQQAEGGGEKEGGPSESEPRAR